jgi:hypothetical protein
MLEFISPPGVAVISTVISTSASLLTHIALMFRCDSIHRGTPALMRIAHCSGLKNSGSGRMK